MVSTNKLVLISLLGAGSCGGMILLFNRKLSNTIKSSAHYKEAISLVKNHEGAKKFLGDPINDLKPELVHNSFTFQGISEAKVNVVGPKSNGVVYITLVGDSSDSLRLDTIQLQIGSDTSKRLLIKESKREIPSPKS